MDLWSLNDVVKTSIFPDVLSFLAHLDCMTDDVFINVEPSEIELDLTGKPINPYQLGKLLEELGYRRENMDQNGWEMDFWIYYSHENKRPVVISGCGMTHKLVLSYDECAALHY